jgi:hypothetical protein
MPCVRDIELPPEVNGNCARLVRRLFPVAPRRFMPMRIVHRSAAKLLVMFHRTFPASRKTPMVAVAIVEVMIDMPIEMRWSVEPRPGADEYAP